MEQSVEKLAHDFDIGYGEVIPEGTVIVMGEYLGDSHFNEITMQGRFANSNGVDGEDVTYTERTSLESPIYSGM